MSGENKSLAEKVTDLEKVLEEYEDQIGLKVAGRKTSYLNLTEEEIRGLTVDMAGEIATSLAFYSLYLQKELNKQIGRVNWCEANLRIVYGEQSNDYSSYSSYEEKKNLIIRDNEYALRLFQLRTKAQTVVDRLSYLPNKIEFIVKTLETLQRSKRKLGRDYA